MIRTYEVTIDWTDKPGLFAGLTPEALADGLLTEYLTLPESVFISDYGPHAWGGYDGPFVKSVSVKSGHGITTWTAPEGTVFGNADSEGVATPNGGEV